MTYSLAGPRCPGVLPSVAECRFLREPEAVSLVRYQNQGPVRVFPQSSAFYAKTRVLRPRSEAGTPRLDDLHEDQTVEGLPSKRRRESKGQKGCRGKGATAGRASARRLGWIEPAMFFPCLALWRRSCFLNTQAQQFSVSECAIVCEVS